MAEVLHESKAAIQSYMIGLLIEGGIVAVLNVAGSAGARAFRTRCCWACWGRCSTSSRTSAGSAAIALPVLMAFVTEGGATGYPAGRGGSVPGHPVR
ncbi:MAG: hypothetical protein WKG07_39160 [Hymenobacter sp.]